jgi:hypothetical protein
MDYLKEIKAALDADGVQAELRTERKAGLYVNVGDVKHVKNRMQFWQHKNTDQIHLYVGKEMGKWFLEAGKSPYLDTESKTSDVEHKLIFPNVTVATGFINEVSNM